ncbi:tRNA pseudouridine(13) synthase TruD [Spongiibacter sp. KMU-158]|uniref:tRNA pseudouridine synthase D n=1 Tax=Spongiibacter pelagi TaxID=2760804 RepID=A0A927GXZ9_9GAMM|nr:tRNA pseudouridine(13) synthase TruD [Spongiibacter pelagi]MBD2859939.1 tRNA pseudouridine(13) synthase TruD [Spongiibacter pelagi]
MSESSPQFDPLKIAFAYGGPACRGSLREHPDDFEVEEIFEVEFSEDGEFDWLWVEKRGENTAFVAKQLARLAGVTERAVTYSGLKDRQALTRQWFCVHKPGKQGRDWQDCFSWQISTGQLEEEFAGWRVLRAGRHRQKLRIGSHRGNRFHLKLGNVQGNQSRLIEQLELIKQGFPNYFGEQRFGRNAGNLYGALAWAQGKSPAGRQQRSLFLSSARSYLFNQVLSARIAKGSWNQGLSGELFCLRDSGSVFSAELDAEIAQRLQSGDIHASGPLFGKPGKLQVADEVDALEQDVFSHYPEFCELLIANGLKAERRSLRVIPKALDGALNGDQLSLSFSLPRGCFATALVRELVDYHPAPVV